MKHLSFIALVGLLVSPLGLLAQSVCQPAFINDDTYPTTANIPERSSNTSAYSYGGLNIGGLSDLYVYTWDNARHLDGGAGIAVRQYAAGTPINNGTTPFAEDSNPPGWPVDKVASAEAVILEFGGTYYILSVYYEIDLQRFFVDIYQWTGTNLVQVGVSQNITVGGQAPFGWIRLDAHNLEEFVITWEEGGRVYAKAGRASTGFTLGNTVQLDDNALNIGQLAQPDVAMGQVPGNPIMTHFVCTNLPGTRLAVSRLRFNDIFTAPPPAPNPVLLAPALEDMQATSGNFDPPRIDAPDNHPRDDWSYVVKNNEIALQEGYIYTGVMNNGTLKHYILNNGSLGSMLPDIASTDPATPHINDYPVVAYDNTGENIYYCWYYFTTVVLDQPYVGIANAYLGLKMDNAGNLFGPLDQYWGTQVNITELSKEPSIALSPQNDASPELFMTFTKVVPGVTYAMGPKTIPWANTQFRPGGSTAIGAHEREHKIQIIPNPFRDGFQLVSEQNRDEQYRVSVFTLTGREILSLQGTLITINEKLSSSKSNMLEAGNYFVELVDVSSGQKQGFKLVKIQ